MGKSVFNAVIKIAAKTLAVLVLLTIFALFILGFIAPMIPADFFDSLGMESLSVSYTRSAFRKSGDINDLDKLISRSLSAKKFNISTEFIPLMLNNVDYSEFCRYKDALISENKIFDGSSYSYDRYVSGSYVLSLAKTSRGDEAIQFATKYMRFDEVTLSFHGIASYFIISGCSSVSEASLSAFTEKAVTLKTAIESCVQDSHATSAKLADAKKALYAEVYGLLSSLNKDASEWSL